MEGKKRKKILLVITKSNFGGAQRYVYDLARSLHTHHADTFDICVAFGGSGLLQQKLEAIGIRTRSIDALGRDVHVFNDIKAAKELLKIISEYKPDILHLNSSKIGAIGSILGRINRVPRIIFTGHGWAFNQKRGILATLLIKCIYLITIYCAHIVIAVSEQTKNDICKLNFVPQNKIKVIYNGIDLNTHSLMQKEEARSALHAIGPNKTVRNDDIYIGTIAELHPRKGLDILIKSLSTLAFPFHTFIIGEGENKKSLQELARKEHVDSKITFTGFVEHASDYLSAFDVFVLPSRDEALPYVLLEAGRARIPVIATHIAGVPEILDHGNAGILISPENPIELASALTTLASSPETRNQFGLALETRIHEIFSHKNMVEHTIHHAYTF